MTKIHSVFLPCPDYSKLYTISRTEIMRVHARIFAYIIVLIRVEQEAV